MDDALDKPLAVYDGDCAFCRFWVDRWKAETGDRAAFVPFQKLAARYPELSEEKFRKAVHVILPDGTVASGAQATFLLMATAGVRRWPLAFYERLPGFAFVSEKAYGLIRRHRGFFLRLSLAWWGEPVEDSHARVRGLFLRAFGAISALVLFSLFLQVPGLFGEGGILPAAETLAAVRARFGPGGPWLVPSLAWLFPSGGFLQILALVGAGCGLALAAGRFSRAAAFGIWISTLSIVAVGGDFTAFPGDALLLEAGFLAIFLAHPSEARPSKTMVWLFRLLAFRIVFGAGLVTLLSGAAPWQDPIAFTHAQEALPLPNPIAWYVHQLPAAVHRAASMLGLLAELTLPFLIFAPRRPRAAAAFGIAALQIAAIATGNHGHFPLLVLVLCLFLLDDAFIARLASARPRGDAPTPSPARAWKFVAPVLLVLSILQITSLAFTFVRRAPGVSQVLSFVAPFRLINDYGPLAPSAARRAEIVLEGSDDGNEWKAYEFAAKPGDPKRAPAWLGSHLPRLDEQMRFAALGGPADSPWLANLATRLLEGSDPVERLFARVPFPDAPPRWLRATLYDYRFTTPRERALDGAWWRREKRTEYFPPLSIR